MFLDSPVFGFGLSSFKFLSPDFQSELTSSEESPFFALYQKDYQAHSDWLEILAENGIVGFLPFCFFILLALWKGMKKAWKEPGFGFFAFSAWVVILVHSFVEFPLQSIPNLVLFSTLSGYFLSDVEFSFANRGFFRKSQKWVRFVLIILFLFPGFFLSRQVVGNFFGTQAGSSMAYLKSFYNNESLLPFFSEEEKSGFPLFFSSDPPPGNSPSPSFLSEIEQDAKDFENRMLLSSRNALKFDPTHFFYNAYFSEAVLSLLPQVGSGEIFLAFVYPLPGYQFKKNYLSSFREPPRTELKLPSMASFSPEDRWTLTVYKFFCQIRMQTVYMPVDPLAFTNIGVVCALVLQMMDENQVPEENGVCWLEWMKYSFDYAFRLKRDFSGVTEGMDLVYLNALKQFDPDPTSFENALVYYLDNWKKLVVHGLQPGLSEGWKEMIAENLDGLSPGVRERVVELREQTLELERGKP